jgi:phage terminase small subunit
MSENLPTIAEPVEPPGVTVRSAYDALSQRKRAFVDHMVLTGDATASYQAVFPASDRSTARYHGSYWSRDPLVGAAIYERMQGAAARSSITLENTIAEIGKLAFSNMRNYIEIQKETGAPYFDFKEVSAEEWAAVAELTVEEYKSRRDDGSRDIIKTKIKLHPKITSLDMLMKRWGAYAAANVNVTGTVHHTGVIATVEMTPEKLAQMYAERLSEAAE